LKGSYCNEEMREMGVFPKTASLVRELTAEDWPVNCSSCLISGLLRADKSSIKTSVRQANQVTHDANTNLASLTVCDATVGFSQGTRI
jgi:hypothetical protein